MFERIGDGTEKILAFKLTGDMNRKEADKIGQILEKAIQENGSIRLFLVMEHYDTMNSAEALYEDLRFAKVHSEGIERMAVIGDRSWKNTWVALFGLFGGLNARYFDKDKMQEAWEWVREKE